MGKTHGPTSHTRYINPNPKTALKRGRDPDLRFDLRSTFDQPVEVPKWSNLTKDLQNLVKGQQGTMSLRRNTRSTSLVQRHIEVSRDVTFEEEVSFKISRGSHMEIDQIDSIDLVDPVALVDVTRDIAVGRKRPTWAHQTLQEVEGYASLCGTF
jgi:hypothetical protein